MVLVTDMMTLSDREYRLIRDLVYRQVGINLGENKKSLVVGRLQKYMREKGFTSFKQYYDHVKNEPTGEAVRSLVTFISTNHTFFFREKEHFSFLYGTVLPEIAGELERKNRKDIRIWSAGCSSGEEPYTLAMLLLEFFGPKIGEWKVGILATDISDRVLEKARKGIYEGENVANLPNRLKYSYLEKHDGSSWIVTDRVRELVLFRRLNLMREDFPFKRKFHVIFCRNVMIYFDGPTRNALVNRFYRYTERGGYLFIGHSESLPRAETPYSYVKPAVYRKK